MASFFSFIRKYKLLHVVFWGLKGANLVHQIVIYESHFRYVAVLDAVVIILFQMLAVYITIYYLLDRFFHRKKYGLFFISSFAVVLLTSFLAIWVKELYTQWFFDPDFQSYYLTAVLGNLIDTLIVVVLFIIVYLSIYYFRKNQDHKKRLRQQLQAELDFLKSQLNPHLVFNTLNSIYVLMDEDVDLARDTLLKFSSLLQYQLYDCSAESTSLGKELDFISGFVELEKIRYGDKIEVRFTQNHIPENKAIAPLLLIPFVENAFKHIFVPSNGKSKIEINANYSNGKLLFNVKNTYNDSLTENKPGGLGLKNVKRRLDLTYPEAYSIDIQKTDEYYHVTLKIDINEANLPDNRR